MVTVQRALFYPLPSLPTGFHYEEELLSPGEERALIASFELLPFREFEFRGFLGKSRTVSYGNSNHAQHTFCVDRRAGIGSTASRPLTRCAIPSPSEACMS
jgi:hypothetical protein